MEGSSRTSDLFAIDPRALDPAPGTSDKEILTIEEVAEYLRLRPQTIYKWAQERRIPAAKLGKEWRFRKSIIDRWVDDKMLSHSADFEHLRDQG